MPIITYQKAALKVIKSVARNAFN